MRSGLLERHRGGRVLEVGNVLSHYGPVDARGRGQVRARAGVRNVDVLDLPPEPAYDLVLSVSTLEHVGRDEDPRDPARAVAALEHLRRLLAARRLLFATVPVGYNPELDRALAVGPLRAARDAARGRGARSTPRRRCRCPYDFLVYSASAVVFARGRALP